MVICLERDADLHIAQLMPLPLTVSCFSKIQIGFTFLVPAHLGSPGKRAIKRVCVCVTVYVLSVLQYINIRVPQYKPLYLLLAGNKTLPISVWGNRGICCTECHLV